MEVVITKKHCEDADYMDITDCPLFRATREQYPEFPLETVAGNYMRNNWDEKFYFDDDLETGWNSLRMKQLLVGEINSFTVKIEE